MVDVDEAKWKIYCTDPEFQQYLSVCKNFDPVGFDRALRQDEDSSSFDFRRVIMAAYVEDAEAGAIQI